MSKKDKGPEAWLAKLYPGLHNLIDTYSHLNDRELAIIMAATLDAALHELLTLRFASKADVAKEFLGSDGNSRAPASAFSARTDLALLVGIISEREKRALDAIREIRNRMAHRVNVDSGDERIVGAAQRLINFLTEKAGGRWPPSLQPMKATNKGDGGS